jgi:hypothetical protein
MSLVDDFLNSGSVTVDVAMGTETMVVGSQSFPVVTNGARESVEGALGGLESDIRLTAMAQPRNVTDGAALLQKRCTVGGRPYRIAEAEVGTVAITFILADVGDSR